MAVIVAGLQIKGKMSGIGSYKCRRQKLFIDAGHNISGRCLVANGLVSFSQSSLLVGAKVSDEKS